MRFFAILLVIVNHYGWGLPGGFIGVDVFFVISGYVITLQIHPSIIKNEFLFVDFWQRRFNRIAPALIFMLTVVCVAFTLILAPNDLSRLYGNLIANIFSLSNVFIFFEYGNYFSSLTKEAPLLHTWSLAVEEQFYIFWPVILILICRIKNSGWFFIALLSLLLFSLLFSEMAAEKYAKASYYLLPMRFFELLTGCILAIYIQNISVKLGKRSKEFLSATGVVLILYSAVTFDRGTVFPGFNAVLPVLGVSFFICAQGARVNRFFSIRLFNTLGQMSYSLYLWHWPFLVALVYLEKNSELNKFIAMVFVFIFSWVSLNYIEAPMRKIQGSTNKRYIYKYLALLVLFLIVLSSAGVFFKGFEQMYESQHRLAFNAVTSSTNESKCLAADRVSNRGLLERCTHSFGSEKVKALLVGDSHANHFKEFLKRMAKSKGNMRLDEHTSESCPPVFDLKFRASQESASHADACYYKNLKSKEIIERGAYDYVILAASWPNDILVISNNGTLSIEKSMYLYEEAFQKTVTMIGKTGAKVIVFDKTPGTGELKYNCPIKKIILEDDRKCLVKVKLNRRFDLLLQSLHERNELMLVSIKELFCKNSVCKLEFEGIPLYRDNSHLNKVASNKLSRMYEEKNGNIFD